MLAALATLSFLSALALGGAVIARTFQDSKRKIVAALRGESLLAAPVLSTRPVIVTMRPRPAPAALRQPAPQWRVAA